MSATPWNEIRGRYLSKMEKGNILLQKTGDIIRYEGMRTPSCFALGNGLSALSANVSRQLNKLKNDEFHVAVVGLEKSGKSTFLNAWLRCDLLPNQTTRCTFTTTEIRTALSQSDQCLVIEYLSRDEFEQLLNDYRAQAAQGGRDAENAQKDLAEIERDMGRLSAFIGRPAEKIPFAELEEIVEPLRAAVADPSQARAVKKALIYTQALSGRPGLVFHDVPGYDSPTKLHKDLARHELSRADVIICVTNISSQVSITESLLSMLDVADAEDIEIKAHQKMFVFLNQADRTQSRAEFDERYQEAVKEWHDRHDKCIPERIVPGSAGVYVKKNIPKFFHTSTGMIAGAEFRFEPPHGDGIDYLKEKIDHYLEYERAAVVSKRCESLLAKTQLTAQGVLDVLSPRYPGSVEDIDRNVSINEISQFSEWFDELWEKYRSDFARFWSEEIMPNAGQIDRIAAKNPTLQNIRSSYEQCIDNIGTSLLSPEQIRVQYQKKFQGNIPQPTKTNFDLRDELRQIALIQGVTQIIDALRSSFIQVSDQIAEWVTKYFYDLEAIRPLTNPNTDAQIYKDRLGYGFETLFVRFARPATMAILAAPRHTTERRRIVRDAYNRDIELLELYYEGDNKDRQHLKKYLLEGQWADPLAARIVETLQDINTALPTPPPVKSTLSALSKAATPAMVTASPAANFDELVQEITEDCEALLYYLKHSVYYAASFESFCEQELLALKDYLLDKLMRKNVRNALIAAKHQGNKQLGDALGGQKIDLQHLREMVGKLDELRILKSQ